MSSNSRRIENYGILLLRADATSTVGMGHIMRCKALAQSWIKHGGSTFFISKCHSHQIVKRVESDGSTIVPIENTYPNSNDLILTLGFIAKCKTNNPTANMWMVIDGYEFDALYQKEIQQTGVKVLVIDDYHHLPEYAFDILLNQNIGAETLGYNGSIGQECLLGTKYVLLRQEFLQYEGFRNTRIKSRENVQNILITLGGADKDNVSLDIIRYLREVNLTHLNVKIIVGPANPNLSALKAELKDSLSGYEIISSSENMPELMNWADVAVSAAGSTCWELAYMGVPSAIIILADNQEIIAEGLEKAGAAVNLGRSKDLNTAKFKNGFLSILNSKSFRMELIQNQRKLVDGFGADRVTIRMNRI